MRKEHDRLLWRKSDKLTPRPSASPYRWDICHYLRGRLACHCFRGRLACHYLPGPLGVPLSLGAAWRAIISRGRLACHYLSGPVGVPLSPGPLGVSLSLGAGWRAIVSGAGWRAIVSGAAWRIVVRRLARHGQRIASSPRKRLRKSEMRPERRTRQGSQHGACKADAKTCCARKRAKLE